MEATQQNMEASSRFSARSTAFMLGAWFRPSTSSPSSPSMAASERIRGQVGQQICGGGQRQRQRQRRRGVQARRTLIDTTACAIDNSWTVMRRPAPAGKHGAGAGKLASRAQLTRALGTLPKRLKELVLLQALGGGLIGRCLPPCSQRFSPGVTVAS